MKAHLYKYTSKLMLDSEREINTKYIGYFKNRKVFDAYVNYENALSHDAIYYVSKTDKYYNAKSDSRTVPPINVVWITKSDYKLIR